MTVERIGVLSGEKLSVKIPYERVPDDNSLRSHTKPTGDDDGVSTVTFDASIPTRVAVGNQIVTFTGFRYFPNEHDGGRRRVEDAYVDFDPTPGHVDHPFDCTIEWLILGLECGFIVVLPKAERTESV